MDMDLEKMQEMAKNIMSGLNLDGFKGDIVAMKYVDTEINGNIESGAIMKQTVYYDSDGKKMQKEKNSNHTETKHFAFQMTSGHSPDDMEKAMDGLRVACGGKNAHVLARKILELEKEGYIQVNDERSADVYKELCATFPMPTISEKAFREAMRLER